MVQIVTLASAFTDTSKDGITTMGFGDVVDEFLNEHSFADTGTTEQTDLSTSGIWGKQVDDLDTSFQNFGCCRLVNELWRIGMDWCKFLGLDGTTLIDGLTDGVHDTAKSLGA